MGADDVEGAEDDVTPRVCIIGDARSIHVRRWAKSLSASGWSVTVYGPFESPDRAIRAIAWSSRPGSPLRHPVASIRQFRDFRAFLSDSFDVIWLHEVNKGPRMAFIPRECPLVVTVYGSDILGTDVDGGYRRVFANRALRQAVAVTAASPFLADATRARFPSLQGNLSVVPFGVDTQQFHPPDSLSSRHRVAFAKSMNPIYGLDVLVKAVAILRDEGIQIDVTAAGGGDSSGYRSLAVRERVDDRIQFLGAVSHDQVAELLRSSYAFVMPTLVQESFGVAAVEAMASGIPVVASRIGAIPDVVQDGATGLLFSPGDARDLADKLRMLVESRELAVAMGANGRERAISMYDWGESVDHMDRVLRSALLDRPGARTL